MMDENISISTLLFGITVGLLGSTWTVILVPLLYRIINPSIVTYPWDNNNNNKISGSSDDDDRGRTSSDPPTIVIFAASYNPPHWGHLKMLEYLSKKYDRVIAVIGYNPNKKYSATPEARANVLRKMLRLAGTQNVAVEVVDGYIWRYASRIGATLFFRGIRSWEKDGKDERHLQILNTWGPLLYGPLTIPIPTIYIEGDPKYNHVSSTLIRTICETTNGNSSSENEANAPSPSTVEALSELVPSELAAEVATLYGTR